MTTTEIINGVLDREGAEYTNRPSDKGGPTKYGITLPVLSEFWGRAATVEQLKALTRDEAYEVFEHLFVIRSGFEKLTDEHVRILMIDWAVNSSIERAIRYLQRVVNVPVDGLFGPQTINAANMMNGRILLKKLGLARQQFYIRTALADERIPDGLAKATNLDNLEGWLNRNWAVAVDPL
jgi:lysozyme family protein